VRWVHPAGWPKIHHPSRLPSALLFLAGLLSEVPRFLIGDSSHVTYRSATLLLVSFFPLLPSGVTGGQVMEAVLESAVRRGVDLVLIQEPRGEKEKDGTRSHPSFTFIRGGENVPAKCWITINRASGCRVTELKELT